MKYWDVSIDDGMVVDKDGSIWIYNSVAENWDYLSQAGGVSEWDARRDLPEEYEPYVRLNDAAQAAILKGLLTKT